MGSFVEEILLNIGGSAVDGSARSGLSNTANEVKTLYDSFTKFSSGSIGSTLSATASLLANTNAGYAMLAGAALGAAAAVGYAGYQIFSSTMQATEAVDKFTQQIASAYGMTGDWAGAMERAASVIPGLQRSAILTDTSVGELAQSFRGLSLLTKGTDADVLALTDSLTVMAKVAGYSGDTLVNVVQRAAISGQLPIRGQAGREFVLNLFPGQSSVDIGAQLKAANESGDLIALLTSKLGDQSDKAKTLADDWGTLGSSWEKISASLKAEVGVAWEPLRELLSEIRNFAMAEEFRSIAKSLGEMGKAVVGLDVAYLRGWFEVIKVLSTPARLELEAIAWALQKIGLYKPPVVSRGPTESGPGVGPTGAVGFPDSGPNFEIDEVALAKAVEKYQAVQDKIAVMHLDGLSKKLATETSAIDAEIGKQVAALNKLSKYPSPATDAEAEQIQDTIDALNVQKATLTGTITREAAQAHTKRVSDLLKEQDEIYALNLSGSEKEMQAAQAAHDAAGRENKAVLEKASHDRIANATLIADTNAKQLADDQKFFTAENIAWAKAVETQAELRQTTGAAFNVETLKANGDTYLSTLASLTEQMRVEKDKLGAALGINPDLETAFAEKWKAIFADAALTQAAATAGMTGEWDKYWEHEQIAIKNGTETWSEGLGKMASDQARFAITAAQGMEAGWNKIQADAQTTGQVIASEMAGAWKAGEQGLTDILSGGNIGDTFKTMFSGIEKSWAKTVTAMVEDYLLGTQKMGDQGPNYGISQGRQGGLLGGDTGSYIGYATAAYAAVSAVVGGLGQNNQTTTFNGQGYDVNYGGNASMTAFISAAAATLVMSAATVTAAAIAAGAAVIPVWGWIAAAAILLVGAIISIVNGPKEGKLGFDLSTMGPGQQGLGGAAYQTYGSEFSSLAGVMQAGGSTASALGNPMEWMKQWKVGFHAGSNDDLTKDITAFFSTEMPKLMESYAFGQVQAGFKNGTTDAGSAGISGLPKFVPGSFDPSAPIPAMLAGLDFTSAKISAIASQIDMRAPDDFAKYLTNLVGVVVAFNLAKGNFSKTGAENWNDVIALQKITPQENFATTAANLTQLAKDLSLYTGDAQITKGQELAKAYTDAFAAETAYITGLVQQAQAFEGLVTSVVTKIAGTLTRNAAIMGGANASDYDVEAANRRLWGVGTKGIGADIAGATTAADVQKFADEAMADINTLFNVWMTRASDALSLMQSFAQMDFGPAAAALIANPDTSLATWAAGAQQMIQRVNAAQGLSGQARLTELHNIETAEQGRYQQELAFIKAIADQTKTLHSSIGQFQADLFVSLMTPKQQGDYYYSHMQADKTALGTATDPAEIQRLTDEIQTFGHAWYALFATNDPARGQAASWLSGFLGTVDAAGTAAYGHATSIIQSAAATYNASVATARTESLGAWDEANTELGKLSGYVDGLNSIVQDKLKKFATDAATAFAGLPEIIAQTKTLFTDVNHALSGAAAPGGVTLPQGLDALANSVGGAGSALDRFAAKLDAFSPGGSTNGANVVAGALYAQRAFGTRNYSGTGI